jgi:hypothetical protein
MYVSANYFLAETYHIREIKPLQANWKCVQFHINKKDIIDSKCITPDGKLTLCCKIFSHVKNKPVLPADSQGFVMDCSKLMLHLKGLFNGMQFSDVMFNIHGHEFRAHKFILAARSEVFSDIFQSASAEDNLTTQPKLTTKKSRRTYSKNDFASFTRAT